MRNVALLIENSREYGRELCRGVARWAHERHDWSLHLISPANLRRGSALAGFDGIIARVCNAATGRKIRTAGIPAVDVSSQQHDPHFISVDCDHAAIARIAAEFFLGRGFRNFAYCGFKGTMFSDARHAAFARRVGEAGFATEEFSGSRERLERQDVFHERADRLRAPARLKAWIASLPAKTALFCANDLRAYQALTIATGLGRRIPDELAILGVDNDSIMCSFSSPPLSSIDPNAARVGYAAAKILQTAMDSPAPAKRRRPFLVRPGNLIERVSTEYRPVEPAWLAKAMLFVEKNMSRPLTTADIVEIAGKSYPTVEKTFSRILGVTAGKWIMRTKLEEAKRLAAGKPLSCKEIAAMTGFRSPQYFCNVYKSFFGETPLAHRRPGARANSTGF